MNLIQQLIEAVSVAERPGATKAQRKEANVLQARINAVFQTLDAENTRLRAMVSGNPDSATNAIGNLRHAFHEEPK